jgi:hypothetical protein
LPKVLFVMTFSRLPDAFRFLTTTGLRPTRVRIEARLAPDALTPVGVFTLTGAWLPSSANAVGRAKRAVGFVFLGIFGWFILKSQPSVRAFRPFFKRAVHSLRLLLAGGTAVPPRAQLTPASKTAGWCFPRELMEFLAP